MTDKDKKSLKRKLRKKAVYIDMDGGEYQLGPGGNYVRWNDIIEILNKMTKGD